MPAQKRPPPSASPAAAAAAASVEDSSPPPPSTVEQHETEEPTPQPQHLEVKSEAANANAVEEQEDEVDETPPPPPPQQQQQQDVEEEKGEEEEELEGDDAEENPQPELPQEQKDDSEGEGGADSGGSDVDSDDEEEDEATADDDRLVPVRLADIRKEVQCPICLGIIRKTRTVMECLHRFCRECIDKSMRLGNNECPACRTHCASRRSLRDDSNYDSLISAVYADIDKYEEEELAFREEEKSRNKKIQAAIAETFRRQAEALGRKRYTAKSATLRRSHGNYRNHGQNSYFRGRGRNYGREIAAATSDDDDDLEANANDGGKESSSADEPSPERRQKRCKRWGAPRSSPARAVSNADIGSAENDDVEVNKETIRTSPLRGGEILAWGKNGTRSQTRHGSIAGSSGRMVKGGRITRLVDHLRNLDQADQLDVHVVLIPLDERSILNLKQPYVCCRPTMSIRHICEFVALQTSVQAEEVQLYAKKIPGGTSVDITILDPPEGQVLEAQEILGSLVTTYASSQGELVLFYNLKMPS